MPWLDRHGLSPRLAAVLDRCKVINDGLGHGFGDELLCSAARLMEQTVCEADTVARMGGDSPDPAST